MASIKRRGDKWLARVRIKGHQSTAKSFQSKSDAEAWSKITESEMIRGTFIKRTDAEQTTLREALERYEREITPGKRGAAIEAYRLARWQKDKLATRSLANLRGSDFATYRDKRQKEAAAATVRLELALISNLFNIARKEWGYEGLANPIESIRMPTVRNARDRVFLEGEEVWLMQALEPATRGEDGLFISGCGNVWMRPLIQLALQTAMRQGELLSLTWENIDLKRRAAYLSITKNGHSRDVPLTVEAVRILEALPRTLRGPAFPTSANAVKLGFVRALKRARALYLADCNVQGIEPDNRMLADLHFHDLRHEATSRLAGKLQAHELAKVTGHRDLRMVMRYYHPKAEDLARKIG
jgi:integrase